jgi:hypothetical protein
VYRNASVLRLKWIVSNRVLTSLRQNPQVNAIAARRLGESNQKTFEMQVLQIRKSQARIVSTTSVGF